MPWSRRFYTRFAGCSGLSGFIQDSPVLFGVFAFFLFFCGFVPAHRRYPRASDASGHAVATLSISKESNFQTGNWLFRIRGHYSYGFKAILYPCL